MPAKPVFVYFDAKGRGEVCRLTFVTAGVQFEDRRITFDQWPALKPDTPAGSLPYLEVQRQNNGQTETVQISQSLAIARHIARVYNLYGENDSEAEEIDEVVEHVRDLHEAGIEIAFESDPEAKKKMEDEWPAKMASKLSYLEQCVAANGAPEGWTAGRKVSLADIHMFCAVDGLGLVEYLKDYPALKKNHQQFTKKVAAYLAKRPTTLF